MLNLKVLSMIASTLVALLKQLCRGHSTTPHPARLSPPVSHTRRYLLVDLAERRPKHSLID